MPIMPSASPKRAFVVKPACDHGCKHSVDVGSDKKNDLFNYSIFGSDSAWSKMIARNLSGNLLSHGGEGISTDELVRPGDCSCTEN